MEENTLQEEMIVIHTAFVLAREEQVKKFGDLFAEELEAARELLARVEEGKFYRPSTYNEKRWHRKDFQDAKKSSSKI